MTRLSGKVRFLTHVQWNCYLQENTLKVLEICFFSFAQITTSRVNPVAFMIVSVFFNISWKAVGILVEERVQFWLQFAADSCLRLPGVLQSINTLS